MTQPQTLDGFQIGDAVIADFNDAQIPGVIEDIHNGKAYVYLAQPWMDENGQKNDRLWLNPQQLTRHIQETGGEQALPNPNS